MKFRSPQPELVRQEAQRIVRDPGSRPDQVELAIQALWPDEGRDRERAQKLIVARREIAEEFAPPKLLDPGHAREVVRRWGTDGELRGGEGWQGIPPPVPMDSDLIGTAIRTLWPNEDDAEAMRGILLPECVMMAGNSWWCALCHDATACGRDARLVPVRSASSVEYSLVTQRRWPTCSACRALLLECREWMPEWSAVEGQGGEP